VITSKDDGHVARKGRD